MEDFAKGVKGDSTDGLTAEKSDVSMAEESEKAAERRAFADKLLEGCVKNWESKSAEEKKKMWSIFNESGVFVPVCRHGFILWVIDMIRSGEL